MAACMRSNAVGVINGPTSVPASSGLPIGRVAYAADILLDDLVDARAVDDGAAQRRASLTGGSGRGERHAAHDQLDVGRRRDDGRVVAAELEDAAPEAAGDDTCHLLAHAGRAGRADRAAHRGGPPARRRRRRRRARPG